MANDNFKKPTEIRPSLSDITARDSFIAVALRELIAKQVEDWKVNHEMAATLAVRYANAVMVARAAETTPLKVVVSKGAPPEPLKPIPDAEKVDGPPPKSIAEIIGEAEPVAEVK